MTLPQVNTAEHTEGPWAVNPFAAQVEAFGPNGGETICQLVWPTAIRSETETAANARLIAAAPELLDALRQAKEWLEGWGSAERQLAIINAAISKATGTP